MYVCIITQMYLYQLFCTYLRWEPHRLLELVFRPFVYVLKYIHWINIFLIHVLGCSRQHFAKHKMPKSEPIAKFQTIGNLVYIHMYHINSSHKLSQWQHITLFNAFFYPIQTVIRVYWKVTNWFLSFINNYYVPQ